MLDRECVCIRISLAIRDPRPTMSGGRPSLKAFPTSIPGGFILRRTPSGVVACCPSNTPHPARLLKPVAGTFDRATRSPCDDRSRSASMSALLCIPDSSCQNRNWPGILGGLFFLEKSRMVSRPDLPRGKRSDQADDLRVVFRRLLAYPAHRTFCGLLIAGSRTGRRRGCHGRRWHHVPCVGAIFPVCAFLYDDAHVRSSDVLASNVSCPGAGLIKRLLA
jgi:hypothetical protein